MALAAIPPGILEDLPLKTAACRINLGTGGQGLFLSETSRKRTKLRLSSGPPLQGGKDIADLSHPPARAFK